MKKLALLSVVASFGFLAACQNDTSKLEKKLDEINAKLDKALKGGGKPARVEPDRTKTYAVPVDGDPVDGPADAKITLVKAYDYACPYCEKVRDTMDELKKKYGNDIRIVYKQFVVHPQVATAGALAVCAADKQGKFVEMDKLLWDKGFKGRQFDKDATGPNGAQRCWESEAGCPVVLGFANELQLDADKFKSDMKACNALIAKDQKELQALAVSATPSFFVNGRFMSGAMPAENFSALIDEEMKKANEKIQGGTAQADYYKEWVLNKGLKTVAPAAQ